MLFSILFHATIYVSKQLPPSGPTFSPGVRCSYAGIPAFMPPSGPTFSPGVSYAGIYVPTLAVLVASDATINLKGIAVGNGVTSWEVNSNSQVYYMYYHGFVDEEIWKYLQNKCCPLKMDRCNFSKGKDKKCM